MCRFLVTEPKSNLTLLQLDSDPFLKTIVETVHLKWFYFSLRSPTNFWRPFFFWMQQHQWNHYVNGANASVFERFHINFLFFYIPPLATRNLSHATTTLTWERYQLKLGGKPKHAKYSQPCFSMSIFKLDASFSLSILFCQLCLLFSLKMGSNISHWLFVYWLNLSLSCFAPKIVELLFLFARLPISFDLSINSFWVNLKFGKLRSLCVVYASVNVITW